MNRCISLLLILFVAGCNGVGVRRTRTVGVFESFRDSAAGDTISVRTLQTLRSWDLDQTYLTDVSGVIRQLHALAEKDPEPDILYALAEITYLHGRRTEKSNCADALPYYYLSAGYAYHCLFGPRPTSPFDPRFRLACDLYNAGLAKCIRAAQLFDRLDSCRELTIPARDGSNFTLSISHHGFTWKPEEFGPLMLCEDYRPEGLGTQVRTYGLGVPLIATRKAPTPDPNRGLYPLGVSFPVTAFFRFDGGLSALQTQRAGRLELYNPLTVQGIDVGGVRTPLETDLTTPIAYFLSRADIEKFGFKGFLRPDSVSRLSGVYLVEPYQPGKIPVLFVHGLLSSPDRWAPMYNDLLADPRIRERYQFWFYLYPTVDPYLVTAANLRDQLHQLRDRLDPQCKDAALDNMVLLGHSMGGLVSRMLTADSGEDFYRLFSDEPLDQSQASPEAKQELRRVFYFERQPCVTRVVFLGTPHHGSKLSPSLPGRILRYFVRLPKDLVTLTADLTQVESDYPGGKPEKVTISLDLLAPGAPALEMLASRPKPESVHFHSIIGVAPPTKRVWLEKLLSGGRHEKGDGVVPYSSAHLADVDSELIVPAEHTEIHSHPLSMQEVRRILLEHLNTPKSRALQGQREPGSSTSERVPASMR
jgi:pimeloyl-ACP methyl ester carboxylesterase